jgi:DNA-binding XRE family transcriptional regulator
MTKKIKIVGRKIGTLTPEQRADYAEIRRLAEKDFPPAESSKPSLPRTGIAAQIRRARKAQGLTWDAVAQIAGIPDSNTVRDIESGLDAKLSFVEAVAKAVGLKLEAVEA